MAKKGQAKWPSNKHPIPRRLRKERLYRKTFTRDGERYEVPEWSVRLQHLGRTRGIRARTANAAVAATKAKGNRYLSRCERLGAHIGEV